jgi:hypothetical protein
MKPRFYQVWPRCYVSSVGTMRKFDAGARR